MKRQLVLTAVLLFIGSVAVAQTYVVKAMSLAATSQANYKELNKVSNARDENALKAMLENDRAVILQAGTKVKVLEGIITYKITVLDGKHKGKTLYIAAEFVRRN